MSRELMERAKEVGLLKQILKDVEDVKARVVRVESLLGGEELTKEETRQIKISNKEIRKGNYVTLNQLKKELRP